jgi:hypothetical protein
VPRPPDGLVGRLPAITKLIGAAGLTSNVEGLSIYDFGAATDLAREATKSLMPYHKPIVTSIAATSVTPFTILFV